MIKKHCWIVLGILASSLALAAPVNGHEQDYGHYGAAIYDPAIGRRGRFCFGMQAHTENEAESFARNLGCSGGGNAKIGQGWGVTYVNYVDGLWSHEFGITRDGAQASAQEMCRSVSQNPNSCALYAIIHTSDAGGFRYFDQSAGLTEQQTTSERVYCDWTVTGRCGDPPILLQEEYYGH